MPKSRSELITLAFESTKRRLVREGVDPILASLQAKMHVARLYNLKSFLDVNAHIRAARKGNKR